MARNFSGTPKEYMKLRCYTKNGRPFYIKHDTFIKGSLDDETGDFNLERQQAKGKDIKSNVNTNSQNLLNNSVLRKRKKKTKKIEGRSSKKTSKINGFPEIREKDNQNKNEKQENKKDFAKASMESGESKSDIFMEPVGTGFLPEDEKKKQMVIQRSETSSNKGKLNNDEPHALGVQNQLYEISMSIKANEGDSMKEMKNKGEISKDNIDSLPKNEDYIQEKVMQCVPGYIWQTSIQMSDSSKVEKIKDICVLDEEKHQDWLMKTTAFGKDLLEDKPQALGVQNQVEESVPLYGISTDTSADREGDMKEMKSEMRGEILEEEIDSLPINEDNIQEKVLPCVPEKIKDSYMSDEEEIQDGLMKTTAFVKDLKEDEIQALGVRNQVEESAEPFCEISIDLSANKGNMKELEKKKKGEISEEDIYSLPIKKDSIQKTVLQSVPGYICRTSIDKSDSNRGEKIKEKYMSNEKENEDGLMKTTAFEKVLKGDKVHTLGVQDRVEGFPELLYDVSMDISTNKEGNINEIENKMMKDIKEEDIDSLPINEDNIQDKVLQSVPEKVKDKCMSENEDGLMKTTAFGRDLKEDIKGVNRNDNLMSEECKTCKKTTSEIDCTDSKLHNDDVENESHGFTDSKLECSPKVNLAVEEQVMQEEICMHWVTVTEVDTAYENELEIESNQNKVKEVFLYSDNRNMENIEKGLKIAENTGKKTEISFYEGSENDNQVHLKNDKESIRDELKNKWLCGQELPEQIQIEIGGLAAWWLELARRSEVKTKIEALRNVTEEKVTNAQKRTESMFMDFESLAAWNLEIKRRIQSYKKRHVCRQEILKKIFNAQKRTEDMFTEIENLAAWKLEVERRAAMEMKREAFRNETAEKITKSWKRVEAMFTEIEDLAIWKFEVQQRAEANKKRQSFIKEIADKIANTQNKMKDMFTEKGRLAVWKVEVERRTDSNYKEEAFRKETVERVKKGEKRTEDIFTKFEDLAKENKDIETAHDTIEQFQQKFENVENKEDFILDKFTYLKEKQECLDISREREKQRSHEDDGSIQKIALIDIGKNQLEKLQQEIFQQFQSILPLLSIIWFLCLLLKIIQDEIQQQHDQDKKTPEYEYFDICQWP